MKTAFCMQTSAKSQVLLICRMTIAFVWFYHGVFPKLLGPDADELAMNLALGVSKETATIISYVAGSFEVVVAVMVLLCLNRLWPMWLTLIAMLGLLFYVAIFAPRLLTSAFNAVTINVAIMAMAAIVIILEQDIKISKT